MEQKTKLRKLTRVLFDTCVDELQQKVDQKRPICEIKISWELLRKQYDELKVIEADVGSLILGDKDTTEEKYVEEMQTSKEYKRRFLNMHQRVNEVLAIEENLSVAGSSTTQNTSIRRCKIPHIELKKFDGSVKDWLPFWASFPKVHEDSNLDPADKIEYLRLATVPQSRARSLVDNYPATGTNYELIVEALKSRFGREELQIEVYVRELLKIITNNAVASTKPDTTALYGQIETQTRFLGKLGISSAKWGAMLFPLIESCIPEDLLRLWHRLNYSRDADATEIPGADVAFSKIVLATECLGLKKYQRKEARGQQAEVQERYQRPSVWSA